LTQPKNAKNIEERGLAFNLVSELDWAKAVIDEDTRKNYGERRFRVLGCINERLYAVVFTPRADSAARHQLAQGQFQRGKTLWQNAQILN
jgi:uncharacterized DUF497 family protein